MSKITLLKRATPVAPEAGKLSIFFDEDGELYKIDSSANLTKISQQSWKDGDELEFMGRTYGVVQSLTGRLWLDRNLGASQVATSSNDANAFGDLYQWGRAADGHHQVKSPTTSTRAATANAGHGNFVIYNAATADWITPANNSFWQSSSRINLPAPVGWRLPTVAEWEAEIATWGSLNIAGAFASVLKLPAAGYRNNVNGTITDTGTQGNYWTSNTADYFSTRLIISSGANLWNDVRARGYSIRLIKDE